MAKTSKVFSICDYGLHFECIKIHSTNTYKLYRISYDIGSDGMYHKHRNLFMTSDNISKCLGTIYEISKPWGAGKTEHVS